MAILQIYKNNPHGDAVDLRCCFEPGEIFVHRKFPQTLRFNNQINRDSLACVFVQ